MVSFFSGEDSPSTDTQSFYIFITGSMPFRYLWATLYSEQNTNEGMIVVGEIVDCYNYVND